MKKIFAFYEKKKDIARNFMEYSEYMLPGKYEFNSTLNYIYKTDHPTSEKIEAMFENSFLVVTAKNSLVKSTALFFMRMLFHNGFTVKPAEKKVEFLGTAYVPGAENDSKIFDLVNKKVMIIFHDKQSFEVKLKNYHFFNKHFLVPEIIEFNDDLLVTERFIDYKTPDVWEQQDLDDVIKDIFSRYISYIEDCIQNDQFTLKKVSSLTAGKSKDSAVVSFTDKFIPDELLNTSFPFLKLHGDLWNSNILMDEGRNIYYVDWEGSRDFIMFYDILHLIWYKIKHLGSRGVAESNSFHYFRRYMSGDYDEYFKVLFQKADLEFEERYRREYLSISVLNYINNRYSESDEREYKHIFTRYEDLLKGEVTEGTP